jgi:hypothetical protein
MSAQEPAVASPRGGPTLSSAKAWDPILDAHQLALAASLAAAEAALQLQSRLVREPTLAEVRAGFAALARAEAALAASRRALQAATGQS